MNRESDAADRLTRAIRDLITEAVQAAIERDRPPPPAQQPAPRRLYTVAEARQQLDGISQTTFYELVNARELSTIKIGRRTFVAASELDSYIQRAARRR
jgi:excisionase family DNA binding protein